MLLAVLIVSFLVHVFSIDYISSDPHNQRFFSYLSIFTFFIIILVTGDNYLIIFVGWEGIGISSYLLINFWFTRIQANKSAIKALVTNRIGDMFLSISFFAIFIVYGNVDYSTIFSISPFINEQIITFIGLLLLLGAIGKSAQFGLHVWLPDAMEGPTPVSALIHAATLVTAGVYLMLRSSPILEYSNTVLITITFVGSITAFFACTTGLLQNDLKRVIAYSTCSQIGYLFISTGLSQYNVALFHLVNHAFFKALLFLSAGAVLHATYDEQDQRKLGGLIGFLPFSYTSILIGSLSLIAIPFITGFYSKDLILELSYSQYTFKGIIAYYLGTISAFVTAFYSLRLISITFLTYPNANKNIYLNAHDAPTIVMFCLIILSILAIFFGYITRDIYVGIANDFFNDALFISPINVTIVEAEFGVNQTVKLMPLYATITGAILAFYLYHNNNSKNNTNNAYFVNLFSNNNVFIKMLYRFFNGKYYFDVIYNNYIINNSLKIGYNTSKVLDRGAIEIVGPQGLQNKLLETSFNIGKIDTGNTVLYALIMMISLVLIIYASFISKLSIIEIPFSQDLALVLLSTLFIMMFITNSKKLL